MQEKSEDALKTIGEVARDLEIPTHVLRFWEEKFDFVTPEKRRGRRYYKLEELLLFREIKDLLYNQKYTIEGAKIYLKQKNNNIIEHNLNIDNRNQILQNTIEKLKNLRDKLTN